MRLGKAFANGRCSICLIGSRPDSELLASKFCIYFRKPASAVISIARTLQSAPSSVFNNQEFRPPHEVRPGFILF